MCSRILFMKQEVSSLKSTFGKEANLLFYTGLIKLH